MNLPTLKIVLLDIIAPIMINALSVINVPSVKNVNFVNVNRVHLLTRGHLVMMSHLLISVVWFISWEGDASVKIYRDVLDNNTSFLHFKIYNMRLII